MGLDTQPLEIQISRGGGSVGGGPSTNPPPPPPSLKCNSRPSTDFPSGNSATAKFLKKCGWHQAWQARMLVFTPPPPPPDILSYTWAHSE